MRAGESPKLGVHRPGTYSSHPVASTTHTAHDDTDGHSYCRSVSRNVSLRIPKSPFFDTHSTADFFLGSSFEANLELSSQWMDSRGPLVYYCTVVRHFSTHLRDSRVHPGQSAATELGERQFQGL